MQPNQVGPEPPTDETWSRLRAALQTILDEGATNLNFEEIYRYAYNMVIFNRGRELYDGVSRLLSDHLDRIAETVLIPALPHTESEASTDINASMSERFLEIFNTVWEEYQSSVRKIRDLLKYMDMVFASSKGLPKIAVVGNTLFEHLVKAIISQIQLALDGQPISRVHPKRCLENLSAIREPGAQVSINHSDVEPALVKHFEEHMGFNEEATLAMLSRLCAEEEGPLRP